MASTPRRTFKKVTYTLPEEVVDRIEDNVEKGYRSKFIVEAIEEKLLREKLTPAPEKVKNPYLNLVKLAKDVPKISRDEIKRSREEGRS